MIKIGIDARLAKAGGKEAEKAVKDVGTEAKKSAKQLEMFDNAVDDAGKASKKASKPVKDLGEETKKTGTFAKDATKMVTKFFTAIAVAGAVAHTVGKLKEFESGLVGVGKTANIEGAALQALGRDISALGAVVGGTPEKFLEIAAAAGQLGVTGTENILAFTKTIAQLESASDLAGEAAAISLARILNATDEVAGNVTILGSVIVRLGNSVAATESEIANHATSVALSTSVYGTSSTEAAAYGAALAAMGVRAELSGSAIARTYRTIDAASRAGGPALASLQKIAGEDIAQVFSASSAQGMLQFVKGLAKLTKAGGDSTKALADLGLNGEEILKVLPAMAKGVDSLSRAFDLAADEEKNVGALTAEAAKAFDTFGGQLGRAGSGLNALQQSLSSANGPMKQLATLGGSVAFALAGVRTEGDKVSTTAEVLAGSLKVAFLPATFAGVFFGVRALGTLATSLRAATLAAGGLNAALIANPYAAVAAGVAALAMAFITFGDDVDDSTQSIIKNQEALNALEMVKRARAGGSSGVVGSEDTIKGEIRALEEMQILLASIGDGGKAKPLKGNELADLLGVDFKELQKLAGEMFPIKGQHVRFDVSMQFGLIHDRVQELKGALRDLAAETKGSDVFAFSDDVLNLEASMTKARDGILKLLDVPTTEFEDLLGAITASGAEGDKAAALTLLAAEIVGLGEALEQLNASSSAENVIANLKEENALRLEVGHAFERENELRKFGNDLRAASVADADDLVAALREELAVRDQLSSISAQDKGILRLKDELSAFKLNVLERERFFELEQHGQALLAAGTDDLVGGLREYEALLQEVQEAAYFEKLGQSLAGSMGNGMKDVILGVKDFGDALNDTLLNVGEQLLDAVIFQPLIDNMAAGISSMLPSILPGPATGDSVALAASAAAAAKTLTGGGVGAGLAMEASAARAAALLRTATVIPSAKGNVFSGGSVVPFAMGGIVERPTTFPMTNNQTGLMGEAGAEGILPLKRNKQGKLGVMSDGGGGGVTNNRYVNMTVHATDANSFRRSKRQIMADLNR